MSFPARNQLKRPGRESGATSVEFALTAIVFFTLLLGIMEFGRVLWLWNASAEATRLGARIAVVCSPADSGNITAKMQSRMPLLTAANIDIDYFPAACTVETCQSISVGITGLTVNSIVPLINLALPVPPFYTALPRESMSSTGNPDCI